MIAEVEKRFRRRVENMDSLPTVQAILVPLTECLNQPADQVDVDKVVKLVSYDKSIAAQCLRMANSPLFGRRQAVASVHGAVVSLGLQRVRDILLSCCMNCMLPKTSWGIEPNTFWKHSLGCAFVSRRLAKEAHFEDAEKAYLAGLMHDLGFLVNSLAAGAEFRRATEMARVEQIPLLEAEEKVMGITHCESGRMLAVHWRLPADITEAVRFHHDAEAANEARPLVALVHLADLLCRMCGMGYGYAEWQQLDLLAEPAWEMLSEQYPHLRDVDLARLTFEQDDFLPDIQKTVEAVFA